MRTYDYACLLMPDLAPLEDVELAPIWILIDSAWVSQVTASLGQPTARLSVDCTPTPPSYSEAHLVAHLGDAGADIGGLEIVAISNAVGSLGGSENLIVNAQVIVAPGRSGEPRVAIHAQTASGVSPSGLPLRSTNIEAALP